MHDATKQTVLARLKRIEGQVGGLMRMIEEDRYCVDILTQIHAVRAALHKVEEQVLRDHVAHCVADAFSSGEVADQQQKVEELIGAILKPHDSLGLEPALSILTRIGPIIPARDWPGIDHHGSCLRSGGCPALLPYAPAAGSPSACSSC